LVVAMDEISKSSQEIGKVIKTIEDIAFQTNILALNAAVEAARAGAAGKGFAVVADEVRNLASKSAEAAKGTTELIEGSVKSVENGTSLVADTAKALLSVMGDTQEVAELVDRISAASTEQAGSVNQVTQGIDQISAVVQTNSATAEQSAAASEELSGQAAMLKQLVGQFNLKDVSRSLSNN
ncbi:MAG: methyl-accepting chemotaxis protein, partial [Oscillospiraceae bacterium]